MKLVEHIYDLNIGEIYFLKLNNVKIRAKLKTIYAVTKEDYYRLINEGVYCIIDLSHGNMPETRSIIEEDKYINCKIQDKDCILCKTKLIKEKIIYYYLIFEEYVLLPYNRLSLVDSRQNTDTRELDESSKFHDIDEKRRLVSIEIPESGIIPKQNIKINIEIYNISIIKLYKEKNIIYKFR